MEHVTVSSESLPISNITTSPSNDQNSSFSHTDSIIQKLRNSSHGFSDDGISDNRLDDLIPNTNNEEESSSVEQATIYNVGIHQNSEDLNYDLDEDNNGEESILDHISHASESHSVEDYVNDSSDDEEYFDDLSSNDVDVANHLKKLASIISDEESNEPLNIDIFMSKIEMILAILNFSKKYNLPTSGIVDLFKMQNMFLNKKIFPENRYQFDKLFNPGGGTQYHGVCPKCKTYIGIFGKGQRSMICEVCDKVINLKDPSYTDFFVTIDIKSELQNLIETNENSYIDIVTRRNKECTGPLTNIYDGQKYRQFLSALPDDHKESYVSVIFNSDGSPLFKSSKFSIWPIQIVVNEMPDHIRSKGTITCALWFGHDKPNMTYFLRPFVEYINDLSQNGFTCRLRNETKKLHLYALCCCVDSVARAPMQGIIQFNGYYGCNWCLHPGVRVRHDTGYSMKYPLMDEYPERRTENDTFQLMQRSVESNIPILGVKNATPLLYLNNFNIIDGFVPCPMHCIDLGVAKQFANYWFGSYGQPYSIPKWKIKIIDEYIMNFKVPTQIVRLSRSVSDRKYWKAAEWSNWILYYSIPVLKLLSDEIEEFEVYLNHWSLIVEAYHILLQNEISFRDLERANYLLKKFISETELLYSKDAMTYNVHQLIHLIQSVLDWGPLWAHSGYVFESGNGKIKRIVQAAKGILSQVCRSLHVNESIRILKKHVEETKEDSTALEYINYLDNGYIEQTTKFAYRYFGRMNTDSAIEQFQLSTHSTRAYKKLIKNGCLFKTRLNILYRSDNSFAVLKDGRFIQIEQFLVDMINRKEYTTYKTVRVNDTLLISNELHSIKAVDGINTNLEITETENIDRLCVYMSIGNHCYVSSIPNAYKN